MTIVCVVTPPKQVKYTCGPSLTDIDRFATNQAVDPSPPRTCTRDTEEGSG